MTIATDGTAPLKAPFPYAGGKSRVAAEVWARIGDTPIYCEPFFGSGAVLLGRPAAHEWWDRIETVNDLDGLLANFWRAVKADPEAVARWADWPVNENDLHARHSWLVGQKASIQARLEGDPHYHDAKVAGWWVWGICCWIASAWCNTNGTWVVGEDAEGFAVLVNRNVAEETNGEGVNRQLPHLGDAGMGIHRQLPHLGAGSGIHRKRPHLGGAGRGHCDAWAAHLAATMQDLADRLRRVRVCCGNWDRILGPAPTVNRGLTGVFLDPPYSHAERDAAIYTTETDCAQDVLQWCRAHGDDPLLRIALCGYEGEHDVLAEEHGWECFAWKTPGGYGNQSTGDGRGKANAHRERIWFSPHCLKPAVTVQTILFEEDDEWATA